mmetsp:Transcript_56889/g.123079  ORF Transcript_56889/g.123079 Transcript_56889/m.123079 type:complete len:341 (-) Transcript_56889:155-1177(-)
MQGAVAFKGGLSVPRRAKPEASVSYGSDEVDEIEGRAGAAGRWEVGAPPGEWPSSASVRSSARRTTNASKASDCSFMSLQTEYEFPSHGQDLLLGAMHYNTSAMPRPYGMQLNAGAATGLQSVPQGGFFAPQRALAGENSFSPKDQFIDTLFTEDVYGAIPTQNVDVPWVHSAVASTSAAGLPDLASQKTTVMLRNLPDGFSREEVMDILKAEGFGNRVDFIYVPMNFRNKASFGYAFVNLVSPEAAEKCRERFEGFKAWPRQSEKICEVSWSDMHQGLEAHVDRYRNSPVMHESVPDEFKPAVFANGMRVAFPPATKALRPPRVRRPQADQDDADEVAL